MTVEISYGAAEVVTGSCHLLQFDDGTRLLVDCGLFQGVEEYRNYEPFDFDPEEIDYLLLTHGHLDHVGRAPLLVKGGFKGKVVATPATFDIAQIVLLDSARLMEEDYRTAYRKAQRRGEEERVRPPLYRPTDVREFL
ncbi:MAG: MBL fold metallo-hydrolase, partial [Epsilonproteobacteria bacterium]|nr:MBL fold metallo-hydrolase [Campylobacterota bacterium]NPA56217.1 MBL fold metallo-hydrolase [Campylobacterota bacterium]